MFESNAEACEVRATLRCASGNSRCIFYEMQRSNIRNVHPATRAVAIVIVKREWNPHG